MAESETDNLKPLDFVYCGKRLDAKGNPIFGILVVGDANLRMYAWHTSASRRAIGGLYSGASFDADTAKGLPSAKFVRMAATSEQHALWRAAEDEAELLLKSNRLEANAKKVDQIDEWMLPLRKLYHNSVNGMDRHALMNAVQRSLLKKPQKEK